MATTRKTEPHLAALARVDDTEGQARAAGTRRDDARTHLVDLQGRTLSGDQSVSGLDLMSARGDVETAEGVLDRTARMLAEAQGEAAAMLAEKTAHEVRSGLGNFDMDKFLGDAQKALGRAVRAVTEAVSTRDAASDAAGQRLADAGLPTGRWVNGIRYEPVRTDSNSVSVRGGEVTYTRAVIPGRYNVAVETPEGGTAWLASEGLTRNSGEVIGSILDQAWASVRS